tara:strand:- start:724 stop:951 length:228 start_codon:yes stop_codon:yes gene_type:complete
MILSISWVLWYSHHLTQKSMASLEAKAHFIDSSPAIKPTVFVVSVFVACSVQLKVRASNKSRIWFFLDLWFLVNT